MIRLPSCFSAVSGCQLAHGFFHGLVRRRSVDSGGVFMDFFPSLVVTYLSEANRSCAPSQSVGKAFNWQLHWGCGKVRRPHGSSLYRPAKAFSAFCERTESLDHLTSSKGPALCLDKGLKGIFEQVINPPPQKKIDLP